MESRDVMGDSALTAAAGNGHLDVVRELLIYGKENPRETDQMQPLR